MKLLIRCILLVLLVLPGFTRLVAQPSAQPADSVEIIADPRIDRLVQLHIRANQSDPTIDGFRLQVFSDSGVNSKSKAMAVQEELRAKFPDQGVYLSFKSPNYKVRIGDFRTRLDAQRFLVELSADYPNAFIIEEGINLPNPF